MTVTDGSSGPLSTLKVVEFAGIGPAPYAGMLLGDMGAGKSSLALAMSLRMAQAGISSAFFTAEMTVERVMERRGPNASQPPAMRSAAVRK